MNTRALPFDGIDNFRDYGGYQTAGGGKLKSGLLFRSGHHGDATEADIDRLHNLAIGAVTDLRSIAERVHAPSRRPHAFAGRIYEIAVESGQPPSDVMDAFANSATRDEARKLFAATYAALARSRSMHDAYRAHFAALADVDGASVIHCSAGKDRTGIGCAFTLRALGVHADDIMADYLLTNTLGDLEQRRRLNNEKVQMMMGGRLPDHALDVLAFVEPDYLHSAFAEVEARPGGWDAFLRDEMGVDASWRAKAERALLD